MRKLKSEISKVLDEDKLATEKVEKMIQAYGDNLPNEMLTAGDKNCVKGRRMLEQMIMNEINRQQDLVAT